MGQRFKNGPSKICGRQPLKTLKGYGLFKLWSAFTLSILEYFVSFKLQVKRMTKMVTECAFRKLKRRWRVLSKKCEINREILQRFGLA